MRKKTYDYIFVAVMIALSLYVGITAYHFPRADIEEGFGPGIYPMIIAAAIFILAIIQLIITLKSKDNEKIKGLDLVSLKMPAAFWGLLLLFCLLLKTLGLFLDSFLYILVTSRFLFKVKWKNAIITAVIVPLILWAAFDYGMKVPFPEGAIWELFK
jgi:hypothetical protein